MKLALFDIDGVLADDTHRVHHATQEKPNWGAYFSPSTVAKDGVWEESRVAIQAMLDAGWTIGYLTGRGQSLKETTERWLDDNEFPFGRVITRGWWSGNQKGREVLSAFKARIIGEILLRPEIEDVVLFEDDPEVVRVIREEFGPEKAELIPWHTKPQALIKKATA